MADPALLIFPLLSSIAMLAVLLSFALPVLIVHHTVRASLASLGAPHGAAPSSYVAVYLFYVISYSITMFFNTALIAVVLRRLDGDDTASVREGLQMTFDNWYSILGYAVIAATVGTILRAIEQRVGFIGRLVTGLIGAGWTLATSMTLPVLAAENVGPFEAISRSLELLRKNWGENLIGNAGISIGMAVVTVPLALIAVLFVMFAISTKAIGLVILSLAVMLFTVVGLSLVGTTLHSIYTVSLYRFATGNKDNATIGANLLADAYRQK